MTFATYHSNGCDQDNTAGHCGTSTIGDFATIPYGGGVTHLDGANFAFADGHVKWLKGVNQGYAGTQNGALYLGIQNGRTSHAVAGQYPTFALN